MIRPLIGWIVCLAGFHQWQSEPRVSRDEYASVIDHWCDYCGRQRFDQHGHYTSIYDRIRNATGLRIA